jgi:hypothetical protein
MSNQYAPDELPTHLDVMIHTHYCYNSEYKWQMGAIDHSTSDLSGDKYVCLARTPIRVNIEAPGDLKKMVIDALEAEKKKQMAEYHKKMFELQEKIDSLLCLTYQPPEPILEDTANDVPF